MSNSEVTGQPITKRPFLRRGTGLKRFYKDQDLEQLFTSTRDRVMTRNTDKDLSNEFVCRREQVKDLSSYDLVPTSTLRSVNPIQSLLKPTGSPHRNLNVRFGVGETHHPLVHSDADSQSYSDSDSESSSDGDDSWETDSDNEIEESDKTSELPQTTVEDEYEIIIPETNLHNLAPPPFQWINTKDEELQTFEKMEQMTSNQSFCSTASTVQRFINKPSHPHVVKNTQDSIAGQIQGQVCDLESHPLRNILVPELEKYLKSKLADNVRKYIPHVEINPPPEADSKHCETRQEKPRGESKHLETLLATRIKHLEVQIRKHKKENNRISELRDSLDSDSAKLKRDRSEFESLRIKDLELLQDMKARLRSDQEKLDKELADVKRIKSTLQKENIDITKLKSRCEEAEKELKVRSSRWGASARNYKATIEKLTTENTKLKTMVDELRISQRTLTRNQFRAKRGILQIQDQAENLQLPESVNTALFHEINQTSGLESIKENHLDSKQLNEYPVNTGENANSRKEEEVVDENGAKRILSADGLCVMVQYLNGDIKDLRELTTKGITKYYFREADVWEITNIDGTQVLHFGTGEVETKRPNGVHEINYGTGTIRRSFPDGTEECTFPDKTVVRTHSDGDRSVHLPNGQVEFHGKELKIRIYPDGTEKVLYPDGFSITRYSSGRQRWRDSSGEIVYDRLVEKNSKSSDSQNPKSKTSNQSETTGMPTGI